MEKLGLKDHSSKRIRVVNLLSKAYFRRQYSPVIDKFYKLLLRIEWRDHDLFLTKENKIMWVWQFTPPDRPAEKRFVALTVELLI